jgi:CBS domain-containing protein
MASVMTPFPYFVGPDESVRRARELMVEHEMRHLPVLREHQLIGIVTDRDLKRALDPDLGLPGKDELFVRDVYVPEPYVVDVATTLDVVLAEMVQRHVGSVLIAKHGRLAGIFTAMDACRLFEEHLRRSSSASSGQGVA